MAPGAATSVPQLLLLPARDEPPEVAETLALPLGSAKTLIGAGADATTRLGGGRGGRIMNDPRDEAIDTLSKLRAGHEPLADGSTQAVTT